MDSGSVEFIGKGMNHHTHLATCKYQDRLLPIALVGNQSKRRKQISNLVGSASLNSERKDRVNTTSSVEKQLVNYYTVNVTMNHKLNNVEPDHRLDG